MRFVYVLLLPGLLGFACHSGQAPEARTPVQPRGATPPQVDCHRMCWRTFGECTREVLSVTVRVPPKQLVAYERQGLLHAFKAAGFQRCMQMCGRASAPVVRQPLIAACLRLSSCTAYASCITPRGGLPGATSQDRTGP